ncbi:19728_t:CDS:1, partial [Dentiscutata erythropus]
MQYNLGRSSGGGDIDIYCPFFDTMVKKSHYTCQGVKICENLDPAIKTKIHLD